MLTTYDSLNMGWTTKTLSFTADTTSPRSSLSARLTCRRSMSPIPNFPNCCYGPVLDNVPVVQAIPEPHTWALLITGFGLMGFAAPMPTLRLPS